MTGSPRAHRSSFVAASYWLPPVVLCAIIFLISSGPVPEEIPTFVLSDKMTHAAVFGALAILVARALGATTGLPLARAAALALLLTFLYGVSDEFHQFFVPTRNADLLDLLADLMGAGGGVAGWLFHTIRAPFRRPRVDTSPPHPQ